MGVTAKLLEFATVFEKVLNGIKMFQTACFENTQKPLRRVLSNVTHQLMKGVDIRHGARFRFSRRR